MNFKDFKKDVESAFNAMIADNLFVVNVDKDLLWMSYLLSFEDETIRQDHNCNACKSFIRHYGKVVAIDPQTYKVKTFWDDVHTLAMKRLHLIWLNSLRKPEQEIYSFRMLMSFTVVTIMCSFFLMELLELGLTCT